MFLTDLIFANISAMVPWPGAKLYHKAPIMIANDVVEAIGNNGMFKSVEAVNPGLLILI